NYHPVRLENQANIHAGQQEANHNAGTKDIIDAGEDESAQDYFVLPIWSSYSSTITIALKTDEKREGPKEEEQAFWMNLKDVRGKKRRLMRKLKLSGRSLHKKLRTWLYKKQELLRLAVLTFLVLLAHQLKLAVLTYLIMLAHQSVLTLSDPTNPEQDDSEIPPLKDIYQNSTDSCESLRNRSLQPIKDDSQNV
ncbi:hypothetical protein Tco_0136333, partial [Tanacetum coccineum]